MPWTPRWPPAPASRPRVEVTLDDGRQVDVHLDRSFAGIDAAGDRGEGGGG